MWGVFTVSRPHWVCPSSCTCAFSVYTAQAPGCSVGNYPKQALGFVHFPGLSCSDSSSQVLHKAKTWLDMRFVPFPGPSSSGDQVLGERGLCDLSPSLSLTLGFLGVQPAHLLWCAVCLFWGANFWLGPSWWMSTVQNPKKELG